jgi:prepilin peptidase CpaA
MATWDQWIPGGRIEGFLMPAIALGGPTTTTIGVLASCLLLVVVAVAAYTDVRSGRIFNKLTYGAAGAGLMLNTLAYGLAGAVASAEGWLLGAAVFIAFFLLGAMGAGDVKLMAAVGAIMGPLFLVNAFLFTGLAGGVIAMIVVLRRRRVGYMLASMSLQLQSVLVFKQLPQPEDPRTSSLGFPYGVAIAIGSVAALFVRVL